MNKCITSFLTLFFMVLLCNMANAQLQHDDSPAPEIDQLLKKIDTVLQKEHIPGLMISIVKKDSILFSGGLGYADLEQKIKIIDLCLVLLPSLGIICFLASYRLLGVTDAVNKERFTSVNATSISIFAGMLFFGVNVIIVAHLLYRRWPQTTNKWVKFPLVFNILFLFYLVVILSVHGWIGVPIWSM